MGQNGLRFRNHVVGEVVGHGGGKVCRRALFARGFRHLGFPGFGETLGDLHRGLAAGFKHGRCVGQGHRICLGIEAAYGPNHGTRRPDRVKGSRAREMDHDAVEGNHGGNALRHFGNQAVGDGHHHDMGVSQCTRGVRQRRGPWTPELFAQGSRRPFATAHHVQDLVAVALPRWTKFAGNPTRADEHHAVVSHGERLCVVGCACERRGTNRASSTRTPATTS